MHERTQDCSSASPPLQQNLAMFAPVAEGPGKVHARPAHSRKHIIRLQQARQAQRAGLILIHFEKHIGHVG